MFKKFLEKTFKYGTLEVIDYDGKKYIFGNSEPFTSIRFHKKDIKKKLYLNPELYLGEAYVDGDITIENGDLETFINIVSKNYNYIVKDFTHHILDLINLFAEFFQGRNLQDISKKNVSHHYDINEEIYKLFLDKDMQYSCAYFHNENISLDQAQIDKKNHLIKKLNINKNNMKVLDIGSGWGGMALQIAKDTGAYVKGVTLSDNQYVTSKKRAKELSLDSKVDFDLIDYRNLNEKFDRIISVGMFEHVGKKEYQKFFKKIYDLLNDEGVCVLHTIGTMHPPSKTNPWIKKYIFPGGYIPSLSDIVPVIEKNKLWINDIEFLQLHYATTLKNWRINFNRNREKISKILDEKFCRMWEFYLLSSEYSFRNLGNQVFQIQITKNLDNLPFTRNYIYN
ncbi:MAG: Cyclopropane-fatty-acyl-phospholipid synthase [Alphaproteobacteria bacterium MarineAlpha5_Bin12]|nr:MAG: Cyclopropane-fatty-acyl-phospholipid synthase [Alphaproteobacteria bacterium MarineAlpha5_Bin12]|tara:strand:+ start:7384 stop:8568 length:1185 start_codon:yes stop_codon:yes gene_type:complete